MKHIILTLFIAFSIILSSCSDDEPGITPEQRQLIMGDDGEGVLLLGLAGPIVTERDDVHASTRELDMDRNTELDVIIRAYQDFFGDKGLVISTPNTAANAQVMVDEDGFVIPMDAGEIVKFDEGTWAAVDMAPLAVFDAGAGSTTGLWNGVQNKYVAFRMQVDNTRFLAWIELSVSDHDNYSFYNYGIKIVP
jgi:hypothetical protein